MSPLVSKHVFWPQDVTKACRHQVHNKHTGQVNRSMMNLMRLLRGVIRALKDAGINYTVVISGIFLGYLWFATLRDTLLP